MIGHRRITATLTIEDFSILMTNDIGATLLSIIKDKYQGRCYLKCFIISVDSIVHMSDIEFNQNDISNCSCNVNIIFDCTAEIIYPGEIVKNMHILSYKPSFTTLGDANKIAIVKEDTKNTEGDVVCVRAIYEPGSSKIKMGCSMPDKLKKFSLSGLVHLTEDSLAECRHVHSFSSTHFSINGVTIDQVDESPESKLISKEEFLEYMILRNNYLVNNVR